MKKDWYNIWAPDQSGEYVVVGHVYSDWVVDADNLAKAEFGPRAYAQATGGMNTKTPIGTPRPRLLYERLNPLSPGADVALIAGVIAVGVAGYFIFRPKPAAAATTAPALPSAPAQIAAAAAAIGLTPDEYAQSYGYTNAASMALTGGAVT